MDGQQRRRLTEEPVYPYETQSDLVTVLALPRSELEHHSRLMQERHVSYIISIHSRTHTHKHTKKSSISFSISLRSDIGGGSGVDAPSALHSPTNACAARSTRSSAGCSSVAGRSAPRGSARTYAARYVSARARSAAGVSSAGVRTKRRSLCVLMTRRSAAWSVCVGRSAWSVVVSEVVVVVRISEM